MFVKQKGSLILQEGTEKVPLKAKKVEISVVESFCLFLFYNKGINIRRVGKQ
ncbi:hypothetical protein NDK43_24360 [Neobacillus pocheonensis]|uniref:Uncharacterized protein n=1 Tax=Neobacillus pocheonensis TaxID=363869 RepID=A0ABT0WFQ3_9BACI|nr:hypothetical protein [Neobacillus pocheonensis]